MDEHEINVRRPLFDRLVDSEPRVAREARPLRTLDRAGLKQSVHRELELLFNTRSPDPVHRIPIRERSVIDYGIPDLGSYSARNDDHRVELAEIMRRAAVTYEPRLTDVRVRLVPIPGRDLALAAHIEASMMIEGVPEPVSFEVVLQMREGKVNVDVGA
jgi:type VI secretion system protein ImpF